MTPAPSKPATRPLLEVNDLKKHFPIRSGFLSGISGYVYAVDGVSFAIDRGETLSLVGESGCGKSTVGRTVLRLIEPTAGQVLLDGERIDDIPLGRLRPLRRRMQVVFQDPFSSLNPRRVSQSAGRRAGSRVARDRVMIAGGPVLSWGVVLTTVGPEKSARGSRGGGPDCP